ncbi:hypothetical protein [Azospirillum brasilense]|uniref:hypothetical protein n=1 Tax=Azospirillum brasilense TaxID=192 RepID=UPI001EDC6A70|nr:hypothetical protein [Azospirillum brasilense]UKJ74239.1 hypothetical protein H1Q64_06550 [Azospirillum brasilense]
MRFSLFLSMGGDKSAYEVGSDLKKAGGMDGDWDYFEHEGVLFRRPAGRPGGVTHIRDGNGWASYKGDRTAPVMFGDRILVNGDEAGEDHRA